MVPRYRFHSLVAALREPALDRRRCIRTRALLTVACVRAGGARSPSPEKSRNRKRSGDLRVSGMASRSRRRRQGRGINSFRCTRLCSTRSGRVSGISPMISGMPAMAAPELERDVSDRVAHHNDAPFRPSPRDVDMRCRSTPHRPCLTPPSVYLMFSFRASEIAGFPVVSRAGARGIGDAECAFPGAGVPDSGRGLRSSCPIRPDLS